MSNVAARRKRVEQIGDRVSDWILYSIIAAIVGAIAFRIFAGGWPLNDGTWFFVFVFGGFGVLGLLQFILNVFIRPPAQPSQRLVASRDANDMPHVSWLSHDGERGTTLWGTPYEDVTQYIHMAEINIFNGAFVVKRWGAARERIWVKDDGTKSTREKIAIGDAATPEVICAGSADEVKAFSIGEASISELVSSDLALFRSNRLRFTEHNVVKVEFVNSQLNVISRDQQERRHTEEVIAALAREFIINRPPGGWAVVTKLKSEIAVAASLREKYQREATQRWAQPQPAPVVYEGRKFAAFTLSPLEGKNSTSETIRAGALIPVTLDDYRTKWLVHPVAGVHRFSPGEVFSNASTHVSAFTECRDGMSYATGAMATFFPADGNRNADTVTIMMASQRGYHNFEKQMSAIKMYHIFTGKDLMIPMTHLPHDDVVLSDDALILAIEFSDGEFIPLTYATHTPRERLNEQLANLIEAQRVCGLLEIPRTEGMTAAPVPQGKEGHDPV